MRRNGETNPVTILVVIALAGLGFFLFHVAPIYLDNLNVKEIVGQAFNNYFIEGEDRARTMLLVRMNEREKSVTHSEYDDSGEVVVKPGYGITPEQVEFDFDEKEKILTVRLTYERVVLFSPLKKFKVYRFVVEKKGKRL